MKHFFPFVIHYSILEIDENAPHGPALPRMAPGKNFRAHLGFIGAKVKVPKTCIKSSKKSAKAEITLQA